MHTNFESFAGCDEFSSLLANETIMTDVAPSRRCLVVRAKWLCKDWILTSMSEERTIPLFAMSV